MADIICNTSPLQYLFQTAHLDLLPSLFGQLTIPEAVLAEVHEGRRRGIPLPHIESYPWVVVKQAGGQILAPLIGDLGPGEREVLVLAIENPGSTVILDDALARRYAAHLGIPLVGTLGLLLRAKGKGLIPAVAPILDQLEALRFRLDAETRRAVLKLAAEHVL